MDLSENFDSGRFSSKRSNFSQTCSLLSQYLKENGSFKDLNLGLTQNFEPKGAPTGTMNLLPMIEKSRAPTHDLNMAVKKSEQEKAQMTIFYAGKVIVFDDFPADKAKEMMLLATNSSAQNHSTTAFPSPSPSLPPLSPNIVQSPAESATNIVPTPAAPPLASDLPIARKNSISRFLEKRKERAVAKAPYQATAPSKPAKGEPWLGLATRFPQ
ncbi:Protein TIFY 10A [Forsythia ovata]|uniref:Protein TIFY n=1 Tax=Forsythia ovata TaxID=205694 RepID=A0ABD1SRR3_9LAMI